MAQQHFGRVLPLAFRQFPVLRCETLDRQCLYTPVCFEGPLSLVVVGFKTCHYRLMNAWMPLCTGVAGELREKCGQDVVQVYRLVARSAVASLLRGWHCERLRFSVATAATFSKRDAAETLLYASGSPGGRVEQRSLHAAELSRCLLSFGGRRSLLELLQLPDAQRVYVLLVSEGGRVEWAESGNCSTEKATELRRVLQLTPDCQPSLPKIQQVPRSVEA